MDSNGVKKVQDLVLRSELRAWDLVSTGPSSDYYYDVLDGYLELVGPPEPVEEPFDHLDFDEDQDEDWYEDWDDREWWEKLPETEDVEYSMQLVVVKEYIQRQRERAYSIFDYSYDRGTPSRSWKSHRRHQARRFPGRRGDHDELMLADLERREQEDRDYEKAKIEAEEDLDRHESEQYNFDSDDYYEGFTFDDAFDDLEELYRPEIEVAYEVSESDEDTKPSKTEHWMDGQSFDAFDDCEDYWDDDGM